MDLPMILTNVFDSIIMVFLQFVMILFTPIDALLNTIPSLAIIPQSITAIGTYIANVPSTLVSISGLSPHLWNASITIFLLFITISPAINLVKVIYSWFPTKG